MYRLGKPPVAEKLDKTRSFRKSEKKVTCARVYDSSVRPFSYQSPCPPTKRKYMNEIGV